ncbi:protein FAM161B isoform X2 [Brachyhypopomus gauderio]|uniref:protein FAM161B isoform X2 n=1 Tax=Brachyhypopomus gauderio TaxID=698409 RepID=UPI0040417BCD
MDSFHRNNMLVTCLKTPVAVYGRDRVVWRCVDNEDPDGSADSPAINTVPLLSKDRRAMCDDIDPHVFQLSNEEYYRQLTTLRKVHLYTMAQLQHTLGMNLQLRGGVTRNDLLQWGGPNPVLPGKLKKSHSAHELRRDSAFLDTDDENCDSDEEHGDYGNYSMKKGLLNFAKKHIKNMWRNFTVDTLSPQRRHLSSASFPSRPVNDCVASHPKVKCRWQQSQNRLQVTVPEPFHMTLQEAELRRKGGKSHTEVEYEDAKLRREMEELAECQRQFRAGPVPAHVHLPLFEELRERWEERRRRRVVATEDRCLCASQRALSFLERERARAEQKEARLRELAREEVEEQRRRRRPFRAKPVPQAVREAASGERQKEEELYRAIRMQMRAREMLQRSSLPSSALAGRLRRRREQKAERLADGAGRQPVSGGKVPDFDRSYGRFQKQLARRRDIRPVTACEPFRMCTANIASHRQRIAAHVEADRRNPRPSRRPFVAQDAPSTRTPASSLFSPLSGHQDNPPAKTTDSAKKRQEAVRKVLEQRKKAEEEEERWWEKQKKQGRWQQQVMSKRAEAYDPHTPLTQTHQLRLSELRRQTLQRHREYQEEMKDMQQRVRNRPLLLEQAAQMNAKRVAARRYAQALQGCGLSEAFIGATPSKGGGQRPDSTPSLPPDGRSAPGHRSAPTALSIDLNCSTPTELQWAKKPAHAISPQSSDRPGDYEDYQQDILGDVKPEEQRGDDRQGNEDNDSAGDQEREDLHTHEDQLAFHRDDDDRDDSDMGSDVIGERRHCSGSKGSRRSQSP